VFGALVGAPNSADVGSMVDPWPSGGLAPRRDGCGRVHGLAALFEDAAAAPVVGSAQVFNTLRL